MNRDIKYFRELIKTCTSNINIVERLQTERRSVSERLNKITNKYPSNRKIKRELHRWKQS